MASLQEVPETSKEVDSAQNIDWDDTDASSDHFSDDDDFMFYDDTHTVETTPWQTLYPVQFPGASGKETRSSGEAPGHKILEVYREVAIFDDTSYNSKDPWIRLLQIKSGTYGESLSCSLIKRPLYDDREYNALSYSWGNGESHREISIATRNLSPSPFRVSTHLWQALQRIRDVCHDVHVWIDAICIDQQNYMERTAQVNIMPQIFNQASMVLVWLGEPAVPLHPGQADARLFLSLCSLPSPWWKRLWIVQECAYAQEYPVIMLGPQTMNFQLLVQRWNTAIGDHISVDNDQRKVLLDNFLLLRMPFDTWAMQKRDNQHRLPLLDRLRAMADRECTEPHDRIYALLSLTDEEEAKQIAPDYRKAYPDLVLEVTQLLLTRPSEDRGQDNELFGFLKVDTWVSQALSIGGIYTHQDWCHWLERAVEEECPKMVDFLARRYPYHREAQGRAIVIASNRGNERVFEVLIRAAMDENVPRKEFGNAFFAAAANGHGNAVRMLLDAGVAENVRGASSDALFTASKYGHVEIVKLLIDKGVLVDRQNGQSGDAVLAAIRGGHEKVVQILVDSGASFNAQIGSQNYSTALYEASKRGNDEIVKLLLRMEVNVNSQRGYRQRALVEAVDRRYEKVVKVLIEEGLDANTRDGAYHRGPALLLASRRGYDEIVRILIDAEGEIDAAEMDYHGAAIRVAEMEGHEKLVKILTDHTADVNSKK